MGWQCRTLHHVAPTLERCGAYYPLFGGGGSAHSYRLGWFPGGYDAVPRHDSTAAATLLEYIVWLQIVLMPVVGGSAKVRFGGFH